MKLGLFRFPTVQIEKIKNEINNNIEILLRKIGQACKEHNVDKANLFFQQTLFAGKICKSLTDLLPSTKQTVKQVFVLSSMFLRDSYNLLNIDKRIESLHFLTGPRLGNTIVLDRIVDFKKEIQTSVFAKGKSDSVSEVLIELARHEHKLHGCFHIHPGNGAAATMPSSTDLKLQQNFDRGGYKVVHAIFSRDGYIRFYSSMDFEIQIYGKGVEEENDGELYRFVEVS